MSTVWVLIMIWNSEPGLSNVYTHNIAFRTQAACERMLDYEEEARRRGSPIASSDARCEELRVAQ